jgi:rubrerythrin
MRYSIFEVMEMAVQTEKSGKSFYETVAAQLREDKVKSLFDFLAGQEAQHVQVFEEISRTVKAAPGDEPYDWDEVALYLHAIVQSRYFLNPDKAKQLAAAVTTPAQAIEHALAFETETLLFYHEVVGMVSAANRPAVERLIAEEKSHIRKLAGLEV